MKTVLLCGVDGYIGNAIAQRLLKKGYKVIGIDNFTRRNNVYEMKSDSAIPIMNMDNKIEEFKKMGDFKFYYFDVRYEIEKLFSENKFDIVLHLAHQPSGPFSMISKSHAHNTIINNITSTNNILWLIKKYNPDCHFITIGTTGEYDHYSNIDIEEGYIKINHKGRESKEMIYPRRPGSIYHSSKTANTYLIDYLARAWRLKCTDVQQSIVFGMYTDEIDETKIYSRFDSDEAFGTVLNRFIVQATLGLPLTIYGDGDHKRGFISLNDSVQALMIAVENEAEEGHVQVWNQLSEWHSMNDIAKMVQYAGSEFGYEVRTKNVPTPRKEYTGDHYYHYVTDILASKGYESTRTIKEEIIYCMSVLNKHFSYEPEIMNKLKKSLSKDSEIIFTR